MSLRFPTVHTCFSYNAPHMVYVNWWSVTIMVEPCYIIRGKCIIFMNSSQAICFNVQNNYHFPMCHTPFTIVMVPGVGVTKAIFSVPWFPHFFEWSKECLPVWYQVCVWQESPRLSCGETWKIWTWLKKSDVQYIPRNMHTGLLCFALLWLCNRS